MRALVLQHTRSEGPGRLADWLPARGIDLAAIHPYAGDPVPGSVGADALIVLGGPMGASDDRVAPWLPAVRELLRRAVADGVPTLGICLGAQLLAAATDGVVERGAVGPELGLGAVTVTDGDELLDAGRMPVVQWHFDSVTKLPPAARLLASSAAYQTQAFRVGDRAWGLQFHVEATPEMVRDWADADGVADVVEPVVAAVDRLAAAGEAVVARFADIVRGRRVSEGG